MDVTAQAKRPPRAPVGRDQPRRQREHTLHVRRARALASATNKDLVEGRVAAGRFREDLFFRLAVFPIKSPALRDRMDDVHLLAEAFLASFCQENGLKKKAFDAAVLPALARRSFPGNVRELKNVVERAAILSGDVVTIADLPEDPHANPFDDDGDGDDRGSASDARASSPTGWGSGSAVSTPIPGVGGPAGDKRETLREHRDRVERGYIVEVLASLEWNISRAAIVLGVERTNLHKKIRAYGIKRGEAS